MTALSVSINSVACVRTFLSSFDLMPAIRSTRSERKVTTDVMGRRRVDRRDIVGTVWCVYVCVCMCVCVCVEGNVRERC